jgi:hypothetical protein
MDNVKDKVDKLRHHYGEVHYAAKFSHSVVNSVREFVKSGNTQKAAALKFGIEQSYVSRIINNKARALN